MYIAINEPDIAFDTSALFNLFEIECDVANGLIDQYEMLGERMFVPATAALEWKRISETRFPEILQRRKQDFLDSPIWSRKPSRGNARVFRFREEKLKSWYEDAEKMARFVELELQEIRGRIEFLLRDRTGASLDNAKREEILRTVPSRFSQKVPPGYHDSQKNSEDRRANDLFIWFEIMEHAKRTKHPVCFVTNELKPDWWFLTSAQEAMYARSELKEEMFAYCGQRFILVHVEYFSRMQRDAERAIEDGQKHLEFFNAILVGHGAEIMFCSFKKLDFNVPLAVESLLASFPGLHSSIAMSPSTKAMLSLHDSADLLFTKTRGVDGMIAGHSLAGLPFGMEKTMALLDGIGSPIRTLSGLEKMLASFPDLHSSLAMLPSTKAMLSLHDLAAPLLGKTSGVADLISSLAGCSSAGLPFSTEKTMALLDGIGSPIGTPLGVEKILASFPDLHSSFAMSPSRKAMLSLHDLANPLLGKTGGVADLIASLVGRSSVGLPFSTEKTMALLNGVDSSIRIQSGIAMSPSVKAMLSLRDHSSLFTKVGGIASMTSLLSGRSPSMMPWISDAVRLYENVELRRKILECGIYEEESRRVMASERRRRTVALRRARRRLRKKKVR